MNGFLIVFTVLGVTEIVGITALMIFVLRAPESWWEPFELGRLEDD